MLRILYDRSLNLYCGAIIDLQGFLAGLGDFHDYPSLSYSFADSVPDAQKGMLSLGRKTAAGPYMIAEVTTRDLNGSIDSMQYLGSDGSKSKLSRLFR
jgi:hypothetical protein